ncbi:hypothetical protein GQX73_g6251 [Xylaria multiplex]|uniref:Uncharacterized protein n=1 Tax=Xylaria multiplex TaxID=323545 RepID=A0A7C8ISZ2_9PEZI|nr:hypothetical protein GQX73_g6251 [Xylaria multiplex]
MASTEIPVPDPNPLVGTTESNEGDIGASSEDRAEPVANTSPLGTPVKDKEVTIQSDEASLKQLHEKIASLEQQLDAEKKLHVKTQNTLDLTRKEWKQVAHELSKRLSDTKPSHIVTDDYLKDLVEALRYDIRCFSEKYFEDLSPQPWPQLSGGRKGTLVLPEKYAQCPASPALAQSFIWRVLEKRVFNRYQWPANDEVGQGLYKLSKSLSPSKHAVLLWTHYTECTHSCKAVSNPGEGENISEYETLRKFHIWRATTANMVFHAEDPEEVQKSWGELAESLMEKRINPITSKIISSSEDERYRKLLIEVIEKALIIDREISRQVAWIRWSFEDLEYHPETVESGIPINQDCLQVITAPALIKRGKSSGEGFGEQLELLAADSSVVVNLSPLGDYSRDEGDSFSI